MTPFTLNINGTLYDITTPKVMGIVNVTPDSFYAPSRANSEEILRRKVTQMVTEGADILDIGAYSTRPGHQPVSPEQETDRICQAMEVIKDLIPTQVLLSVDTFRAQVARVAVQECRIHMVNDISGGAFDPEMHQTVGELKVPYIISHLWGTPQDFPKGYHPSDNPAVEVTSDLLRTIRQCHLKGIIDIIVDPGFGFGKTLEQNYQILANLEDLQATHCPILVGLSRKSMITKALDITPEEAQAPTSALNMVALHHEASIIRVHDVKDARQTIDLYRLLEQNTQRRNQIRHYR